LKQQIKLLTTLQNVATEMTKHFKREVKWMIGIPLAVLAVGLLVALFVPFFIK
jgi:hypothetical protein